MRRFAALGFIALITITATGCDDETTETTGSGASGATGGMGGAGGAGGGGGSAAMPRGEDNPPSLGTQIDRVGRPAIGTATVGTFDADDASKGATKDAYNAASPDSWSTYKEEIQANLAILDSLDGDCGNQFIADQTPGDRYGFLATVLADDQLYVLTTEGECGVYLGLEAEIVGALNAGDGKCGGRLLTDDVIDRSYSLLAAGVLTGVDDTITSGDDTPSDSFPFVAAPGGD